LAVQLVPLTVLLMDVHWAEKKDERMAALTAD
jgi:hypothetical protein